ncbi:MAG TPA: MBL fold metallo-hydrolase [Steroidobacteraceae bacterium]|nr:MBL fold metallo-hydrolase [Steroidobacteraceae bacterium]
MNRLRFVVTSWILAGLSCAGAAAADPPLQIVSIDVEGGAATLYLTPEGKSLLIDSGWPGSMGATSPSSAERIVAAARKLSLRKIDYLLVTHYHVDHVGGVQELLGRFPVGEILDHGPNREVAAADTPQAYMALQPQTLYPEYLRAIAGHPHRSLKPGDTLRIGSLNLTVVTSDRQVLAKPLPGAGQATPECAGMTDKDMDGGEENPRSVGVLLTFGRARIVSLGDLTWNVEKALVCPTNKVGHADLFFVSNHGTNLNNSPALLHALSPRVAIMGNGARKGGDPESYDTVSGSPGLEGFFELHYAEKGGPEHNPPEAYIANPDAKHDQHLPLHVAVFADGRLAVTNERTGRCWTFGPPR